MRTKWTGLAAIGAIAALTLTGCNQGTPGTTPEEGAETPWEVATDVELEGSPTYDAMVEDGVITIGVKEDQPGMGYLDAVTGERSGFDIDIARWVAASLGFTEDQIEYVAVPSANREQAIINGDIDIYVGTYSITPDRMEDVSFAGPYYVTGASLLVAADSDIASIDDLGSDTTGCSATGSTPLQYMNENYPDVPVEEFDQYAQCVEALNNGTVDFVTTDEPILLGYAAQDPENLQVVGETFTEENYGVGLAHDDDALRYFIDDMFTDGNEIWTAIFDANFGATGATGEQPEVDRY